MATTGNRLLDHLPERAQEQILLSARLEELPLRTMLHASQQMPSHAYFLTKGAASIVVNMPEGGSAEVGMIGNEGLIGSHALLGPDPMHAECFMQIVGAGYRVPLKLLQTLFNEDTATRCRILEFVQCQWNASAQLSACNKLHEAEERLARWLLTTSDRSQSDVLGLTQEFLAQMLGSQRTTVALVAGTLQRAGFIDYSRGKVRILDRNGLTGAACDCYRVTSSVVAGLYR